jgi:hypothetical protein
VGYLRAALDSVHHVQRCRLQSERAFFSLAAACLFRDRVIHRPRPIRSCSTVRVALVFETVFFNQSLGKSSEGDLLLKVQVIVSWYERAKIMERNRRGKSTPTSADDRFFPDVDTRR